MYEEETREAIERRTMDRLDPKFDPRVGSINQTNMASAAIEFAKLYQALSYINDQLSPRTADREHLEIWGDTFSIKPLQATYAICKATIEMENGTCPIGSRFTQGTLYFTLITHNGGNEYSVQCEQAGEIGNTAYGRLIPILNIPGLISATITGTEIPGTEVEDDDSLEERIRNNFKDKAYGWNMAEYRAEIAKIQGVGGFKVIRYFEEKDFWIGIYLIDSTFQKATPELVELVQTTLLPILPDYEEPTIQNSGDGLVAIGHVPKVMSAEEKEINVVLHLEFDEKHSYEQLEETIKEKIQDYLTHECNEKWDKGEDHITVRISGIENAVLAIEGVIDIYETEINGSLNNVDLEPLEVTKLGTITHTPKERI